jgi:hypothetical protein
MHSSYLKYPVGDNITKGNTVVDRTGAWSRPMRGLAIWYYQWRNLGFCYQETGMSLCSAYDVALLVDRFFFRNNSV